MEGLQQNNGANTEDILAALEKTSINTAAGLKNCMDDAGFYIEILGEFRDNSGDRKTNLNSAFERNDVQSYRIYVHSLKSAARTIGAEELSALAERLEFAARDGSTDFIAAHHAELLERLDAALEDILSAGAYAQGSYDVLAVELI